ALAAAPATAQTRPGPDVRSYHFTIDLPDSGSEIRGTAVIRIAFAGRRADTLQLDLVGMSVDSVNERLSLQPLPFEYDGKALRIGLPVAPADQVPRVPVVWDIRVVWHGTAHDGLIIEPNARGRWAAFGDNWPQRARDWIPTVDDPAHKAAVRWTVTAPERVRVVANGQFVSRTPAGAGRVAWSYVEIHRIPTYTMVIGATEMTVSRHRPLISGRDTIPMEVWTYPEDSAFADSVPFHRITEVVESLQRIIGPFPYEKLAQVESSTRYGGMENSSAIFYAEQAYVAHWMDEGTVRHETAHQWFGDAVTERDFHHVWLSESFATYFDLVAGAALDGDSVLERGMRNEARGYFNSRVVDRPILDTAVTVLTQLLNANSYNKGAWVLHMLRGYVGDSSFFAGIRDYYRIYRDSSVLSEDFRRVMEQASGRPLGWFFDQWLRQPGYPQLDVRWSYDSTTRELVVNVAQVQPEAWGTFRLPGAVLELTDGSGQVTRRVVEIVSARQQMLRTPLGSPPTVLRVDPDGALLLTAAVQRSRAAR
ncbi:MAG TPA: M1 family aminopeptidase, partial [Gemmatimonadales bacterium]|nr:M1 family aminopeptidase [Gemmatimonadales bacterium]